MKKATGLGVLASGLLPICSLLILMLGLFDPWTRPAAFGLYVAGCVVFIIALRSHKRVRRGLSKVKTRTLSALEQRGLLRKRTALAALIFGGTLIIFPILLPVNDIDFLIVDTSTLDSEITATQHQLRRTEIAVAEAANTFVGAARNFRLSDHASRAALTSAWASYLDHAVLLDALTDRHKHFYQLALRAPSLADRSFLVGYQALVVQMHIGHKLVRAIDGRDHLEAVLNEATPDHSLQRNTYFGFKKGVLGSESLVRLESGYAYLRLLQKAGHLQGTSGDQVLRLAKDTIRIFGRNPLLLVDAPLDRLEQRAFVAWFPLQKGAAVAMSPIRTTHRDNFIEDEDLKWAHTQLQAGDILVQRRNWYLTNLGIPGFWPHAALYVGNLSELDAEFTGEARAMTEGLPPSQFIRQNFPKVYQAFTRLDENGHGPRVIEAIGEGVVLQTFEHSGQADYMGALRPRLADSRRLAAVLEAFGHYGKPYDYNFEFSTDDSVVCSELVYKALMPNGSAPGVTFRLRRQNGRYLLPPNDIVRTFDEEFGTRGQQLDFVFFLDGNEESKMAKRSDGEALRNSWRRPKWDLAQP